MNIIASTSALFFIVVISHVNIREQFPGQGIIYLEYFYLLLYVMMILVITISFTYCKQGFWYSGLFKDDAIWFKLGYWPAVLAFVSTITYVVLF